MTTQRKNIMQPADWWAAFKTAADAEGVSLSEWIGAAGKAKLPKQVASKLSDRKPANRPRKDSS